jgi:hypothetical protein
MEQLLPLTVVLLAGMGAPGSLNPLTARASENMWFHQYFT